MLSRLSIVSGAALVAALGIGAAACGPPSSRYRSDLGVYEREQHPRAVDDGRSLFAGAAELGVEELILAVLERNPSLDEARAGWRAALARYPQVTTFEDPMVSYSIAPLSIGSDVDFGQVVEISQPLPYPGKRRLRGQVALAEADAAREDYRAVRLRVAVMAAHLYYELYTVDRSIAIHAEYQSELEQHRETLTAHLAAGHAWQDDALKVDVELGDVEQARIDLAAERDIIVAQINELLHRSPELPLPPLPATLATPAPLDQPVDELRAVAVRERPELRRAAARERRESARIDVADRDFHGRRHGGSAEKRRLPRSLSRRRAACSLSQSPSSVLECESKCERTRGRPFSERPPCSPARSQVP